MKKELSKIQIYAVAAAKTKVKQAQAEVQMLLDEIAAELEIDLDKPGDRWGLSGDNRFLTKMEDGKKKDVSLTFPNGNKGKKRKKTV